MFSIKKYSLELIFKIVYYIFFIGGGGEGDGRGGVPCFSILSSLKERPHVLH